MAANVPIPPMASAVAITKMELFFDCAQIFGSAIHGIWSTTVNATRVIMAAAKILARMAGISSIPKLVCYITFSY